MTWRSIAMLVLAAVLGGAVALGGQRLLSGPADVRGYLLAHPEVIPEAIQKLQDRESGRAVAANASAVKDPFPGAVGGNPAGDVTIVTFMDYACGYCRQSIADLARVVAADGKVRVVYRELPILSPDSRSGAQMALAAARQGRFMPFHEALFAAGRPTPAAIAAAARTAGLDLARARGDAASSAVAAEIAKNLDLAGKLGMTGTPAWVIGDRVLSGAVGEAGLRDAVAAARR